MSRTSLAPLALVILFGIAVCAMLAPAVGNPMSIAFAEFDASGTFRPVYWCAASVDSSPAVASTVALMTALAFLAMLKGFGVGLPVGTVVVMLWLWHPLHAGLWERLAPAECVALPFAILALESARRAARPGSSRFWDVACVAFTLFALMNRNAFIGIVPAVALTRLGPDELTGRGGNVFQAYRGAVLCGAMLLLGGVGLSSTLGVGAQPELALVGLGLYVLFAALLSGMMEMPLIPARRAAWVGVGAVLVVVLAWNLVQHGVPEKMF